MTWHTSNESAHLSVRRKVMNDDFAVTFSRQDFPQGTESALDALDETERIEQILSVFRFDSIVNTINLTAHENPIHLDKEIFDFIAQCLHFSEETNGAVDIASGSLWKAWGFAKRQGRIPLADEWEQAKNCSGYAWVELDESEQTICLKKQGVELNFGCVGKGFALDIAAEKLREHDMSRYLFQGGLSSMLAVGNDWQLGIAHPLRPGQRIRDLVLSDVAVSTSSSQKQYFRYGGRRYSHIIDPRSGQPAEGVLSVTVLAPSATAAELLSTAFFVLGAEKTAEYCSRHPEIAAILVITPEHVPQHLTFGTCTPLEDVCLVTCGDRACRRD